MSSSSASTVPTFPKPLPSPIPPSLLAEINAHLSTLAPEDILAWGLDHLPNLYQTTAFGLTGLVAIDMLSKLCRGDATSDDAQKTNQEGSKKATRRRVPPLIFLDTLHHFKETHDLVEEVKKRYGYVDADPADYTTRSAVVDAKSDGEAGDKVEEPRKLLYIYKPQGCESVEDFEAKHGKELWEKDENLYDYSVKVEPARRAYAHLSVKSIITGRRASQGGDRASLQPLEVDPTGLFKLNPLFAWTFPFVEWHVSTNSVPRNALLNQGYKSVGDWHSTVKVKEGEGEREGRWKGKEKTECGLHVDYWAGKCASGTQVVGASEGVVANGVEGQDTRRVAATVSVSA